MRQIRWELFRLAAFAVSDDRAWCFYDVEAMLPMTYGMYVYDHEGD